MVLENMMHSEYPTEIKKLLKCITELKSKASLKFMTQVARFCFYLLVSNIFVVPLQGETLENKYIFIKAEKEA